MDPAPQDRDVAAERAADARTLVVDVAAALMYQQGVSATSLDDVVRASGVERAQLDRLFDDKADLVRAVILRQLEVSLHGQSSVDVIDSWDGLQRWVDAVSASQLLFDRPYVCPLGSLAAELKHHEQFADSLDAAFREWERRIAVGLSRIQALGDLDTDVDASRLAASLLAALQGGYLLASVHGDHSIIGDALDGAVAGLRRYRT